MSRHTRPDLGQRPGRRGRLTELDKVLMGKGALDRIPPIGQGQRQRFDRGPRRRRDRDDTDTG